MVREDISDLSITEEAFSSTVVVVVAVVVVGIGFGRPVVGVVSEDCFLSMGISYAEHVRDSIGIAYAEHDRDSILGAEDDDIVRRIVNPVQETCSKEAK